MEDQMEHENVPNKSSLLENIVESDIKTVKGMENLNTACGGTTSPISHLKRNVHARLKINEFKCPQCKTSLQTEKFIGT